jgi:catechol 2,3-dioxygenase-like lactoylglutathione lyase family enzyme
MGSRHTISNLRHAPENVYNHGVHRWNRSTPLSRQTMVKLGKLTPILRIFDDAKAREFYVDFLGFKVDWEHRFEPDMPLYMQLSKDDCVLHLSEHFGDGSPGAHIRIEITGLDEFQQSLLAKHYKHARPGIEDTPWKTREMTIADPSGNRLTFASSIAAS